MEKIFNIVTEFVEESRIQMRDIREQLPEFANLLRKGQFPVFKDFSKFIRAVHSISGGSSFAGLNDMESVSFKLNELISLIILKKADPCAQVAELVEKAIDLINNALNDNGRINKKEASKVEKKIDDLMLMPAKRNDFEEIPVKQVSATNTDEKKIEIEVPEEEKNNEYLSFRIGLEHYAVPISFVYDMKQMLPCSRIPNQSEHFLGVANLRGNIIPVVDLRKVFGIKDVFYGEFTVFLMLKVKEKIKGCVVDSIDDVVFLEPGGAQIAPVTSRKIKTDFVKFIAKDPKTKNFLIVLDVEKMLEND